MDKIAQSANQARSSRGSTFEVNIENLLKEMLKSKKITSFTRSPIIFNKEFNPDFIVEKLDGNIVCIDSTTTARTDRLRGKQWDANGTKLYFNEVKNKEITAVVVVQDTETSDSERANFRRCKVRTTLPHSALDEVVSVDGLVNLLEQ